MFAWLFGKTAKKPAKAIFSYFDGRSNTSIDPIKAHYRLFHERDVNIADLLNIYPSQNLPAKDRSEALFKLMDHVAWAFSLHLYDDKQNPDGLTVAEVEDLMQSFFVYMADVKKKPLEQQNSLQDTGSIGQETSSE